MKKILTISAIVLLIALASKMFKENNELDYTQEAQAQAIINKKSRVN